MAKQKTAESFHACKWLAALFVVLLVGLLAGCSGSSTSSSASSTEASSESASTSASAASVASEPASSSAASASNSSASASSAASASASASSNASAANEPSSSSASAARASSKAATPSLDGAELTAKTTFLEYSNKTTDPLKLVTCNIEGATVTTNDAIDLSKVGDQTITYQISANGQSVDKAVKFTVRDTKSPTIKFFNSAIEVIQGGEVDILSNIESVADEVDGEFEYMESAPRAGGTKAGVEELYTTGWYMARGTVDLEKIGSYPIEIVALDKHGNRETKAFTVVVKSDPSEATEAGAQQYVLNDNANPKKFHRPECPSVRRMNEENRKTVIATREELIKKGYEACKNCNP